jgi:hypothetical protein
MLQLKSDMDIHNKAEMFAKNILAMMTISLNNILRACHDFLIMQKANFMHRKNEYVRKIK